MSMTLKELKYEVELKSMSFTDSNAVFDIDDDMWRKLYLDLTQSYDKYTERMTKIVRDIKWCQDQLKDTNCESSIGDIKEYLNKLHEELVL